MLSGTDEKNRADVVEDDTPDRRKMLASQKAAKRKKALEWLRDKQEREQMAL